MTQEEWCETLRGTQEPGGYAVYGDWLEEHQVEGEERWLAQRLSEFWTWVAEHDLRPVGNTKIDTPSTWWWIAPGSPDNEAVVPREVYNCLPPDRDGDGVPRDCGIFVYSSEQAAWFALFKAWLSAAAELVRKLFMKPEDIFP